MLLFLVSALLLMGWVTFGAKGTRAIIVRKPQLLLGTAGANWLVAGSCIGLVTGFVAHTWLIVSISVDESLPVAVPLGLALTGSLATAALADDLYLRRHPSSGSSATELHG